MASVRKTATKLADGRDFFYFDDSEPYVSGQATRRLDDPRPLADRFAPVPGPDGTETPFTGPIMRYDVLTGDWIPMAAHRMNRTFMPPADANPFAPAREGAEYQDGEIPDTDYDVVVFENRFASLMQVPGVPDKVRYLDNNHLFPERPAAGRCEVICFGPRLDENLVSMGPKRMRTVIEAWVDRTRELSQMPGIEQVFVFENHGEAIGVSLHHPHGQIYAYPYITPYTEKMMRQAKAYRQSHGKNLLSAVLEAELESGERIVAQSEHWVLYVPSAARWPVEMHLAPKRQVPDLPSLTEEEKADLSEFYLKMLRAGNKFHVAADGSPVDLPYVAGWHQAPREAQLDLRLHLQLISIQRSPDKLKYLAGSESGMFAWISDTTPERIAARLREVWED
ncbi:galactose-1-phosphate uridylyltransferase [Boudabousia liubingyangii]|uniref:Galactose-1-phosphate uridylyltransferase n=1 Tax=Boudabousia liubingyangii TaxID=1921764 RepID=A0A1Q5PJS1_9ACTO|nr:galactose-1-phosphate uridylyltransferase [Boudabousia liubingyangii]OKL46187.1 galactose-1-phosphate uridylyltransferase [Boudabousia liubingyangii]OKL46336.1 galactose-1-phosphate uridylyltransferase [Boudabousia liubingyangii]